MIDQQTKYFHIGLSTAYSIQSNMVEDALEGRIPLDQVFTALRKNQMDASKTVLNYNGRNGE